MDTLGARIRLARGKTSQGAFAALIGVSKGSLGGYERDENLPNTDVALKICQQTGFSVEWLLSGRGPLRADAAPCPHESGPPSEAKKAAPYCALPEAGRKAGKAGRGTAGTEYGKPPSLERKQRPERARGASGRTAEKN